MKQSIEAGLELGFWENRAATVHSSKLPISTWTLLAADWDDVLETCFQHWEVVEPLRGGD
jgi:hypothetical protein